MDEWHSPWTAVGFVVGLGLGLGWSLAITGRIIKLGAHMGKQVSQADRLAVHVSREYAPLRRRLEELERRVEALTRAIGGGG